MLDLSTMVAVDTIDIEINDPRTGEPLVGEGGKPCSVTVDSPGSKEFAAARSVASNKAIKRLRSKGKADTTPEEDAASTADFLTRITRSFNNFTFNEADPTSKDTFRSVYLNPGLGWLTDQVNQGAGDWGNALKSETA